MQHQKVSSSALHLHSIISLPSSSTSSTQPSSSSTSRSSSSTQAILWDRRPPQVNLHSYQRPINQEYSPTKVGGRKYDYLRMYSTASREQLFHMDSIWMISPQVYDRRRNVAPLTLHCQGPKTYSSTKVGGHALDHVRFLGRGIPSRPIIWPSEAPFCSACQAHSRYLLALQCRHRYCERCLFRMDIIEKPSGFLVGCQECCSYVALPTMIPNSEVFALLLQFIRRQQVQVLERQWHITAGMFTTLYLVPEAARRVIHLRNSLVQHQESESLQQIYSRSTTKPEQMDLLDAKSQWDARMKLLSPPSKLLRYTFVKVLGKGNFATVLLMQRGKRRCVLKESEHMEEAVNEMNIMSQVQSPYVVNLRDFFVQKVGHQQLAYIEMDYCDKGDLQTLIQHSGALPKLATIFILAQIGKGLQALHRIGIVHRDIKPANILLNNDLSAKIADFGVSTKLESASKTHHVVGTLAFMAPEVRQYFANGGARIEYDARADIWSLGAVALAMLSGNPEPNISSRPRDEVLELLAAKCPKPVAEVISSALAPDPADRVTLVDFLRPLYFISNRTNASPISRL